MFVSRYVSECDETGQRFEEPVLGLACVARGATGRWCEVLWLGPEPRARLEAEGATFLTYGEARAKVEAKGNGDWADF